MYVFSRRLPTLLLIAAALVVTTPARAWVEVQVRSDAVTVDVERDGRAVVAHEILMKIKGGPLTGFELDGVDADAEPLPDGTVTVADSGAAAGSPIPLRMERRETGALRIDVDHDKGLKRGTFLFKLRYRTNFVARDLIRSEGAMVELHWIGPRLPDGLDSARVVFRLPADETPPRVEAPNEAAPPGSETLGTFLSNLHRGHDKDELEIVRPHIAKGEPVVWRVLCSARAFEQFAPPAPAPNSDTSSDESRAHPVRRPLLIGSAAVLALVYSLLVFLKWRGVSRACDVVGAKARALVPLPAALRAALAGAALAGAGVIGAEAISATAAGLLLVVAMALAAQQSPLLNPRPRGPGHWITLSDDEAFAAPRPKLPARWLDAGALAGFALFVFSLGAFAAGAMWLLPRSPYHALSLALGSACLLPIFCTGRASELPDLVVRPRRMLSWMAKKLRKNPSLDVHASARLPAGQTTPDEIRLEVKPNVPLSGLVAIEVGLEYQQGGGGPIALPCVIVRAVDGSPSYRALPRDIVWTRGRDRDERAAVVRPRLPTRTLALALVERLARLLTDARSYASRPPSVVGVAKRQNAGKSAFSPRPKPVNGPSSKACPDERGSNTRAVISR